jgi:hypothetical protein
MEESYSDLIRQRSEYKQKREEKSKLESQDKLSKMIKKKLETTMIGAISSIEEHFGFLWGHDQEGQTSKEQDIMFDLFQEIRSEILDKGNLQSRNVDSELSQYNIEWKKFNMTLPVKQGKKDN